MKVVGNATTELNSNNERGSWSSTGYLIPADCAAAWLSWALTLSKSIPYKRTSLPRSVVLKMIELRDFLRASATPGRPVIQNDPVTMQACAGYLIIIAIAQPSLGVDRTR